MIIYPDPSELENPSFHLCIYFKRPELVKEVLFPIYPIVGETIGILGQNNELWFGLAEAVNYQTRVATVKWYLETQREGDWRLSNQQDQINFSSIVSVHQANRVFGGVSIV